MRYYGEHTKDSLLSVEEINKRCHEIFKDREPDAVYLAVTATDVPYEVMPYVQVDYCTPCFSNTVLTFTPTLNKDLSMVDYLMGTTDVYSKRTQSSVAMLFAEHKKIYIVMWCGDDGVTKVEGAFSTNDLAFEFIDSHDICFRNYYRVIETDLMSTSSIQKKVVATV